MSSFVKKPWIFPSLEAKLYKNEILNVDAHCQLVEIIHEITKLEVIVSDCINTITAIIDTAPLESFKSIYSQDWIEIKGCFMILENFDFEYSLEKNIFVLKVGDFSYLGSECEVIGDPISVNQIRSIKDILNSQACRRLHFSELDVPSNLYCLETIKKSRDSIILSNNRQEKGQVKNQEDSFIEIAQTSQTLEFRNIHNQIGKKQRRSFENNSMRAKLGRVLLYKELFKTPKIFHPFKNRLVLKFQKFKSIMKILNRKKRVLEKSHNVCNNFNIIQNNAKKYAHKIIFQIYRSYIVQNLNSKNNEFIQTFVNLVPGSLKRHIFIQSIELVECSKLGFNNKNQVSINFSDENKDFHQQNSILLENISSSDKHETKLMESLVEDNPNQKIPGKLNASRPNVTKQPKFESTHNICGCKRGIIIVRNKKVSKNFDLSIFSKKKSSAKKKELLKISEKNTSDTCKLEIYNNSKEISKKCLPSSGIIHRNTKILESLNYIIVSKNRYSQVYSYIYVEKLEQGNVYVCRYVLDMLSRIAFKQFLGIGFYTLNELEFSRKKLLNTKKKIRTRNRFILNIRKSRYIDEASCRKTGSNHGISERRNRILKDLDVNKESILDALYFSQSKDHCKKTKRRRKNSI